MRYVGPEVVSITAYKRKYKCLDLFLVSQPENISEVSVFPPIATSDHNMVFCRLARANQQRPSKETRYDFTRAKQRYRKS